MNIVKHWNTWAWEQSRYLLLSHKENILPCYLLLSHKENILSCYLLLLSHKENILPCYLLLLSHKEALCHATFSYSLTKKDSAMQISWATDIDMTLWYNQALFNRSCNVSSHSLVPKSSHVLRTFLSPGLYMHSLIPRLSYSGMWISMDRLVYFPHEHDVIEKVPEFSGQKGYVMHCSMKYTFYAQCVEYSLH